MKIDRKDEGLRTAVANYRPTHNARMAIALKAWLAGHSYIECDRLAGYPASARGKKTWGFVVDISNNVVNKPRRVGIFYWNRRSVQPPSGSAFLQDPWHSVRGYVRVEEAKSSDLEKAMREAKPLAGESFMNTHYLD